MKQNRFSLLVGLTALLVAVSLILRGGLFAPLPARAAGVLYATPNGATSGLCDSWANACTLQTALTTAVDGDEIWVKAGVHTPGTTVSDTFQLKPGVALYSGFAGIETARDARNWRTNVTILSGDIDGNDTNTDGNYIAETAAALQGANAYHVVYSDDVTETARLDGFIITAGQANGAAQHEYGGGMYNNGGSATLANLIFSGNSAGYGGGMTNTGNPTLTNVTFSGNSATSGGGGMHNYGDPTLTDIVFRGNSAEYGGGMHDVGGSPTLTHVTFTGNVATESGGGMSIWGRSTPTLSAVTFSGNSAKSGGGMGNNESSLTLTNVTFYGNTVVQGGGGIYNYTTNITLTNVTFSGNSASIGSGLVNSVSSNATLVNCILWGDTRDEIKNAASTLTASYSNIQWATGVYTGTGNLNADPRFVDAAGGNLRLQATSPAIDAGDSLNVAVATDLDGYTRKVDIASVPNTGTGSPPVDMGAYEVQTQSATLTINYPTGAPGSYFNITGAAYPADRQLTFSVNGVVVGTATTDQNGSFAITLQTWPASANGAYVVTVSMNPVTAVRRQLNTNSATTVQYQLQADAPLRARESDLPVAAVPASIAPVHLVYLPLVVRQ